ncbi:MAG: type II toxin-antitoxin system Phd/YefM family antitoxin [Bacilli bacterium]
MITDMKPTFTADQLVSSSVASKKFGELRKKAKQLPQFITENGAVDTVLVGYGYYEQLFERLSQLEEQEEIRILNERVDRLDKDPASAKSWNEIRREPHE